MRKLVLAFGILVGVVSVSMGAMSEEEVKKKYMVVLRVIIHSIPSPRVPNFCLCRQV